MPAVSTVSSKIGSWENHFSGPPSTACRLAWIFHNGAQADLLVLAPRAAELNDYMLAKQPPDMSKFLLSPMPGLLVKISVKEGDEVKTGEELAVVEAMKMENTLRAERDVTVEKILVKEGDSLAVDQSIIEFS